MIEKEIHLFILWENARQKTDELFILIQEKFEIHDVYEITWNPKNFARNLKRFYGVTLPDPFRKVKQCGTGPFLLVIVSDKNPKHGMRRTSFGKQLVNTNMYDSKRKYRQLFVGGFPIHGSIHEKEANHDLTLLLGKNIEQVYHEIKSKWNGEIKKINLELLGIDGWNDLRELFFVLNNTINYVVLRNFEYLPEKNIDEKHEDIDILTDDYWQIPYILGKNLPEKGKPEFPLVKINEKYVKFDIKYVGDTYLDEKWAQNILKRKKLTKKEIYTPSDEDHFFALLHHIIVQKTNLTNDYKEKLIILGKKIKIENFTSESIDRKNLANLLENYMKKNDYRYTFSFRYKIRHNELLRLINVSIRVLKTEGIKELFRSIRGKFRRKTLKKR